MSEMEVCYGTFKKSDIDITDIDPLDLDDMIYEMENEKGCHLIQYENDIYEVWPIENLEAYGFSILIPPSEDPIFICMWYNGGAGLDEVVGEVIKEHIENEKNK